MPRQIRVQYPGAIDHLMSRGDMREDIYLDDVDRQDFLKTLAETCHKTAWQVHAYCLMSNHFHLVTDTPEANLVDGSETFRQELLQRVEGQMGEHHAGALHREGSHARTERIIAEELSRLGWTNQDLANSRKSDPRKLSLAARLGKEATHQRNPRARSSGHLQKCQRHFTSLYEKVPVKPTNQRWEFE